MPLGKLKGLYPGDERSVGLASESEDGSVLGACGLFLKRINRDMV